MKPGRLKSVLLAILLATSTACAGARGALEQIMDMPAASLLLEDSGKVLVAHNPDTGRIPASTLKILTAWLAIRHWGLDHHFSTDFYLDDQQTLWVKGYGDPMLVSEEIETIAGRLRQTGLHSVNGIRVDSSYFADRLNVDGRSQSNNPYDAPVAALAANFNTLYIRKTANGLSSAEPQTPLTAVARRVAKKLNNGKQRVNIKNARLSARYFGELLRAKLRTQGIVVNGDISNQAVPDHLAPYYHHRNTRSLGDVLRAMLRYSTNFIANQLFLMLGAEANGAPADLSKAQAYALKQIEADFRWTHFSMVEGSGLSRANRISARQMTELLERFRPYKALLPSAEPGILAKTGTLTGISCYAGYIENRPFALFINQPVPYGLRRQATEELRRMAGGGSAPVR
ncbi:MAG TPA: peptidase S13 [Chromatiaceae bacterium]|nr:peptidase S13 [Chromatiaceae bacterium]